MDTNQAAANEYQARIGQDLNVAFEISDYELEQGDSCPLCSEPLNGERFFHLECGRRENAMSDRWEREGRAEMYTTLGIGTY